MTALELKAWLEGYLTGAGENADAKVIAAKVMELTKPPAVTATMAVNSHPVMFRPLTGQMIPPADRVWWTS